MVDTSPLSWFYTLDVRVQAALLAHPHGYLDEGVAASIPKRTKSVRHDEKPQIRRRQKLRSADAIRLEEERLRLDEWWGDLEDETRAALQNHRAVAVPAQYQGAVLDLEPGGVSPGADLEIPFVLSGIAAAYVEMVAARADPR